ncbi:deoxyribose-phosphate aldolase [uncultured Helcococcus sp.]|uniref:deoxyribose-phosphate aldolase n=1 Tax=uncultured Helcococcus sp. TaxID=1072508 RepID=UPI002615A55F|nr:deoxyribose-phosphate aldolase [uncultured Helcococcus sp.]
MDIKKILSYADHTQLAQTATWEDIKRLIDEAAEAKTASVCIPASYVKRAKEYAGDKVAICTVIGFPNGYSTKEVKVFETEDAIKNGADEIDMVININELKNKNYDYVLEEMKEIKKACGDKILKVIIETALLTEEEKIKMCELVSESGAEFIKTSTGFASGGATFEDVKLFADHVADHVQIKAAGGISSLEDAQKFIDLGATRLGTSRLINLAKEAEK